MNFIQKLPEVDEIQSVFALNTEQQRNRRTFVSEIQNILSGRDERKLVIVGPCSADREDAMTDYAVRLAELSQQVKDKLLLVPRVYTGKPRTTGLGYKGMLHNPEANREENILLGISATRQMHLRIIRESGLFPADEMLYPEETYYVMDLLAYSAVGARSVENQGHRMMASDNSIPVGMKNPTGGAMISLVNSVIAAQHSHHMIYRGWEAVTEGNPYAHAILRGYANPYGKSISNYHYEDLCELHDMCVKNNLLNPAVIVDCNHANSNKNYSEQPRIAGEVVNSCKANRALNEFVKGFMIESYLEDGCQQVGSGVYGKSITDPCLGWEKTQRMLKELADRL